jgi:arylsulfatase A-like enzyme
MSSVSFQKGLRAKLSGSLFSSIGEFLTDIDRDGYGLLRRPLDPAPLDAGVFPYAVDIPGNGIDENGVAGDLPVDDTQFTEVATSSGDWAFKPNVIFFLLESIRADLVGSTYDEKVITPVLNDLADEGVTVPLAFTHNGFTSPSRYHLFSGNLAGAPGSSSLIDDFKQNGYEVAYFSAQDVLFGGPNYDIGYSRVDVAYDAQVEPQRRFTTYATPGSIGLPYQVIVEKVTEYLQGRQHKRPLFLYINFQDTHFPYHHRLVRELVSGAALPRSDIGPDRTAELWATYVNTAANVDMAVGEVLKVARRSLEDPAPGVIVTSDHGESLFDDGFLGHGIVLNDVQTRVPLIVSNLPMAIEQPIGLVDFRDTLRSALESSSTFDLTPALTPNPERIVFQYLGNLSRPRQIAVRDLSGRNIYDFRTGRFRSNGGQWLRPQELSKSDVEAFRSLVHQWERMVLAASAAKRSRS